MPPGGGNTTPLKGGNSTKNANKRTHDQLNNSDSTDENNKKVKTLQPQEQQTIVVQHKNMPNGGKFVISTSNQYQVLEDNPKEITTSVQSTKSSKVGRVPPIVVSDVNRSDIAKQMQALSISKYRLKHTSTGLYVYTETVEDHNKYCTNLKTEKIAFFTHDLPQDKFVRVVLIGLDKMDTNTLSAELNELGVKPVDIKTIVPKKSRYTDHMNYILYYPKHETDMRKVYNIKSINHTIVRWEPYRTNRKGATQCRRCLLPGHGTRHCFRPPHCMYCAGDHLSDECDKIEEAMKNATPTMETDNQPAVSEIRNFRPTCFNCKGNHVATSNECPKKTEYSRLQRQLSQKNRKQQQAPPPPIMNTNNFPELPRNGTQGRRHVNVPTQSSGMYQHNAWSCNGTTHPSLTQNNPNKKSNLTNPNNDLFSYDEIVSLLGDVVESLRNCSTKLEQFQAITNLAIKYVYGQP